MADIFTIESTPVTTTQIAFEDDLMVTREIMPAKNVQRILDSTAHLRSTHMPTRQMGALAARIPTTLRNEWRKEWRKTRSNHAMRWGPWLVMKINSSDYSRLRTQDKLL